jgi:hypothetical protein
MAQHSTVYLQSTLFYAVQSAMCSNACACSTTALPAVSACWARDISNAHSSRCASATLLSILSCYPVLVLLQAKERTLDYDLYCILAIRFWSLSEAEFKQTDRPGKLLYTQVDTIL